MADHIKPTVPVKYLPQCMIVNIHFYIIVLILCVLRFGNRKKTASVYLLIASIGFKFI